MGTVPIDTRDGEILVDYDDLRLWCCGTPSNIFVTVRWASTGEEIPYEVWVDEYQEDDWLDLARAWDKTHRELHRAVKERRTELEKKGRDAWHRV